MTKLDWKKTIAVEYADEGLGFFWSDPVQLRQSIVFVPALIRFLEDDPELTVGLREERIIGTDGPVFIHDLARIRDDQVEAIRTRYVQDAVILLDGVRSDYRVRTDGVRHGLLELDIAEERRPRYAATIDDFIVAYAREHEVPFRCTWMTAP